MTATNRPPAAYAGWIPKDLGEDENWLSDIASEMDVEDGLMWVYDADRDGVMAFTDFGIENLIDLIKIHRDHPAPLKLDDSDE